MPRFEKGRAKTGGRQKGLVNKFTKLAKDATAQAALERPNLMPLDFMLSIVVGPTKAEEFRARMAVAATPYCHPRLPP